MKIFIGSSLEGLIIAKRLRNELRKFADCKTWSDNVFEFGNYPLNDLIKYAEEADLGLFIFTEDIEGVRNGVKFRTASSNVFLEYGIFVGKLGKNRSLIISQNYNMQDSDIKGMTILECKDFNSNSVHWKNLIRTLKLKIEQIENKISFNEPVLFPYAATA